MYHARRRRAGDIRPEEGREGRKSQQQDAGQQHIKSASGEREQVRTAEAVERRGEPRMAENQRTGGVNQVYIYL